jgi:CBS domain-containing protein
MNAGLLLPSATRPSAALSLRPMHDVHRVRSTDPATRVVSDFSREQPLTVGEDRSVDDALDQMFRFGVRALLVVREQSGAAVTPVTGLITSYDIQRERSLRAFQGSERGRRDAIRVQDVMTPWEQFPVVNWETLRQARVEHLVQIFEGLGATHLVVVQSEPGGGMMVRGLISRTRLERQLGNPMGHAAQPLG